MSAASSSEESSGRPLRADEFALLSRLLEHAPHLRESLADIRVTEMQDGGMGSLRFSSKAPQRFGSVISEASSLDADGVPVELSIHLDQDGQLLELDIWKVDYSPLLQLPQADTLSLHIGQKAA